MGSFISRGGMMMGIRMAEESQTIYVEVMGGRDKKLIRGEVVGTSGGIVCVLLNNGEYREIFIMRWIISWARWGSSQRIRMH